VQYEVILSIDAPEIIILSEVPTVTNHSPIIINYTVNEEPRTQTFVLVEGVNTITIREANVLGEETVITFDVELDTIGPSIEIISNVPEITELSELNVVYEVDGVTKSETFILRPGDNVIFITESDAAGNQTTVTLEIEMTEEDEEEQTDVTPPPTIPHTIYYYDDSDVITENDIKHARAAQELLLQKYFEKKNAETNSGATVHTAAPESQSSEYSAAQALVIRGIMRGQGNSTANLDLGNKVNRAEIVTMATRLLTLTTPVDQKTLKDISDDSWYKDAVSASIEEGLIQGYPDGTFRGENPVTIVEIIKIASIAAGVASQNDEKSGTLWYEQYVRKAENSGLLSGLPIVQLGAPATRGWVAQILFNADQMIRNR
jgi:hypothetical protein